MKILITADPELPVPPSLYGGIERIIDILARGLQARGHIVGLVAHRDSTCPVDRFFPWAGLRSQNKWDTLRNMATLGSAVQQFQPDVLHSFSRLVYMLPLLAKPLPKIMSYQRCPTEKPVKWAATLAGRSLLFTGCSQHICQQGRNAGGQWRAIHNCVELGKYRFQPVVTEDAPLVFLSRIERIKGAHTAIAVARKANRRLLMAGNQVNTPEGQQYWEEEIAPYIGRDGIEYVGPVDDVQKNELLGRAAAMIVPIEWEEPFGIVFAEALACGTPVISCPVGSLPEIIRSGVEGFLVTDESAACDAIARLSTLDRFQCRQRAEQCFSAEVIVDQYEQLYCSHIPPEVIQSAPAATAS